MLNLIGFLLPPLIDLINRNIKSSDGRFWVSVLLCAIVGIGMNFLQHNGVYDGYTMLDLFDTFAESALAMFGIAQLSYKAVWEQASLRNKLSLNAKTNT